MCHFITLVASTNDVAALRSVMTRHGRVAEPIDNPSIGKVLDEAERQFLTTSGHCDCGTVLASRYGSPKRSRNGLRRKLSV